MYKLLFRHFNRDWELLLLLEWDWELLLLLDRDLELLLPLDWDWELLLLLDWDWELLLLLDWDWELLLILGWDWELVAWDPVFSQLLLPLAKAAGNLRICKFFCPSSVSPSLGLKEGGGEAPPDHHDIDMVGPLKNYLIGNFPFSYFHISFFDK